MTAPIGVFDSGFGGIDILRNIVQTLPQYDYAYLGDTARNPYGTRSQELILQFSKEAVDFFISQHCPLVLFACNTASSEALRVIQETYTHPKVLGVIIPAVEEALEVTRNKKIGVIATEGTVASRAFEREIHKKNESVNIFQRACPTLVQVVESGEYDRPYVDILLQDYLDPLIGEDIDTLILGCTHYGILKKRIQRIAGKNIRVISESEIVASKLQTYLEEHAQIERKISKSGSRIFYTTDLTEKFTVLGAKFFGTPIEAKKVTLI